MIEETGPTYATYTEPALPTLTSAGDIITDPTFGSRILKLTDSGDSAVKCSVAYSLLRYFNTTNTRIAALVHSSYYKLKVWDFNATTMTASNGVVMPQTVAGIQSTGTQFSHTDPDKMLVSCASGTPGSEISKIYSYKPSTQAFTLIKDLTATAVANGGAGSYFFQMSVSDDDDIFAGHVESPGGGVGYIVYKQSTDTILLNQSGITCNEVSIDKSGRYLWVVGGSPDATVWDLQGGPSSTTVTTEISAGQHYALGSGWDLMHSMSSGRIGKRNLASPNGGVTALVATNKWVYGGAGSQQDHYSATGSDTWVLGSRYNTVGGAVVNPFDNECVLVKTDGSGNVRRIAHHRAIFSSYSDAPFASLSQDGRFAIWSSNWGTGGGRYDVYVAEVTVPSGVTMFI
jgi:hypothetical protein